MAMILEYDATVDAASVVVRGPLAPGSRDGTEPLDQGRLVHDGRDGEIDEYEFLNVRHHGVRLDDIKNPEHRAELARLFREAGFSERDWSDPMPEWTPRARNRAAG